MSPVWGSEWSIRIDGVEINDRVNYWAQIPEISNLFEQDAVLAPVDGDYPVLVRMQPKEGVYTCMIWAGGEPADFETKRLALFTLLTPVAHTLSVKVRGMADYKSTQVVPKNVIVSYTERMLSAALLAPKPVLS